MTDLLSTVADQFGPLLLALACVLAFAESALGLGSVVPGEASILALSTAVDRPVEAASLLGAVVLGAVAGDHVGYGLGRWQGGRIRGSRLVRRLGTQHWDRASTMVRRHGCAAVVASRVLPVVRTLMPAVAGASGLRYRVFVLGSLVGSVLWATLWVGAGVLGGSAVAQLGRQIGGPALAVLACLVVAVVVLVRHRSARDRATGLAHSDR